MNDPSPESALAAWQTTVNNGNYRIENVMYEAYQLLRTHGAHFAALARQVESLTAELDFMTARYEEQTAYLVTHRGALIYANAGMRDAYSEEHVRAERAEAELASLTQGVDPKPLPDRLPRESECTAEAAHYFYAQGWNACRDAILSAAPAPAVGADARRFRGVGELERTGYIPEGSAAEREPAKPSAPAVGGGEARLLDALADIAATCRSEPGGETYSATGHSECVPEGSAAEREPAKPSAPAVDSHAIPVELAEIIGNAAKKARDEHAAYIGLKDSDPATLMGLAAVRAYIDATESRPSSEAVEATINPQGINSKLVDREKFALMLTAATSDSTDAPDMAVSRKDIAKLCRAYIGVPVDTDRAGEE